MLQTACPDFVWNCFWIVYFTQFQNFLMKMFMLFLTSKHHIFEKMEHILEVKNVLYLLEHLLFIRETFPSILPRKKIIRHFKNIFSFDSVINILSGTYQPLFCLLSPSYGNRKFYYAHAHLAMITLILGISSTLTGGLVFFLIMNFH